MILLYFGTAHAVYIRKEVGGLVVAWSCGLVAKALVAHASGSIPGDSRFFTSFLS